MGDLEFVEGGYLVMSKVFKAGWRKGVKGYEAALDVPRGTTGEFRLPVLVNGEMPKIVINGKTVEQEKIDWFRRRDDSDESVGGDEDVVVLRDMAGGRYVILVS